MDDSAEMDAKQSGSGAIMLSPCPNVLTHHFAELQRSGVTIETIKAANIYSEADSTKLAALLNWTKYRKNMGAAIVYPYRDDQGRNGFCRIKPDRPRVDRNKKPIKYEQPKGHPLEIYLPPSVAEMFTDATKALAITEGEKKALALTQHGIAAIGLPGVYGFSPKNKMTLLPTLQRVNWNGRNVKIIFDSDVTTNPDVAQGESRLFALLQKQGAIVRCVRLPDGPPDVSGKPTKIGVDDFIVANGLDALYALLNAAGDPGELAPVEVLTDARELDARHAAQQYLEVSRKDGLYCLRYHRGIFRLWKKGSYIEVRPSEVRADVIINLNKVCHHLSTGVVNNVLDQVKAMSLLPFQIEEPAWIGGNSAPWPADEMLPAKNGLVHLPSALDGIADCMLPPSPRFFNSSALDYDFALKASLPELWLRFLYELWGEDCGALDTLQEWFGYLLTPDTSQQKIMLLVGPKRSGKGTIVRVLRSLIGVANVCGPTLASMSTNFGLWPLLGKSLAVVNDARLSGRTDTAVVVERLLSISGEDALTVDRKNLEPVTAKLPTRITLVSNELPRLGDASGALASRMIVLRLTRSFYGDEDHDLTRKLLAELPGILRWAIEGWKRLRDRGRFAQPDSGETMLAELHDLASPVAEFVREGCIVEPSQQVLISDIYGEYKRWAESKGRGHIEDERGFGRLLRAAVPTIDRVQRRVDGDRRCFYSGIGLGCL